MRGLTDRGSARGTDALWSRGAPNASRFRLGWQSASIAFVQIVSINSWTTMMISMPSTVDPLLQIRFREPAPHVEHCSEGLIPTYVWLLWKRRMKRMKSDPMRLARSDGVSLRTVRRKTYLMTSLHLKLLNPSPNDSPRLHQSGTMCLRRRWVCVENSHDHLHFDDPLTLKLILWLWFGFGCFSLAFGDAEDYAPRASRWESDGDKSMDLCRPNYP